MCNLRANSAHNFYLSKNVQNFWNHFNTWFAATFTTSHISLSLKDVVFGKYEAAKDDCLNHAILYAKFYIHKRYIGNQKLIFDNFAHYYVFVLKCEKERYVNNDRLESFEKRFKKCTLLNLLN